MLSFILFSASKDLILDSFFLVCFLIWVNSLFLLASCSLCRVDSSFIFCTRRTLFLFMSPTSLLSFSTCLSYWPWLRSSLACSFLAVWSFFTSPCSRSSLSL